LTTGAVLPATGTARRFLSHGSRHTHLLAALAVFAYLTTIRTRHISETFWLLGDQILYWKMAIGSWHELPLGGGPSSVGGTTLGPAFLWAIWAIRHLVGPFTDNLPHAGGIGLSIMQSAADAFLLVAMWKRFASFALALAVTLLVASAPVDMAISATIWNPPLAVAFVKMSIACVLLGVRFASKWWYAGATATALLALQCHSSAVFFAVPVIASFPAREMQARRYRRALAYACTAAAVIFVLETPFLLDLATHPGKQTSPAKVVGSVSYTLTHPELFRPVAALRALEAQIAIILLLPWTFPWFGALLAVCAALTAFRTRRDVTLASVTVIPLACAVVGFSMWQGDFDSYWFLVLAPSAALTIALGLTAWRPAARLVAVALALLIIAAQPFRIASAMTMLRLPEYGPLVRGSREIRRRVAEVRSIETAFVLPPSSDRYFIYQVLGGRVTPSASYTATIDATGHVTFATVAADQPETGRAE
jgi:hypothetical protein